MSLYTRTSVLRAADAMAQAASLFNTPMGYESYLCARDHLIHELQEFETELSINAVLRYRADLWNAADALKPEV